MSLHERTQRGEQAILLLAVDASYCDPDYGHHSADCWAEAHPQGECWCSGQVADSGPVTLAGFAAAIGDEVAA